MTVNSQMDAVLKELYPPNSNKTHRIFYKTKGYYYVVRFSVRGMDHNPQYLAEISTRRYRNPQELRERGIDVLVSFNPNTNSLNLNKPEMTRMANTLARCQNDLGVNFSKTATKSKSKSKGKTMNIDTKTILALQSQKGVKTVKVRFNKKDPFTLMYKTTLDLKKGDRVLAELRSWYAVATVVEVHDVADMSGDIEKYRWVLGVVNDLIELSERLEHSEKDLERNLVNSRAIKEAREMMKEAGVENLEDMVNVPTLENVRNEFKAPDGTALLKNAGSK